MVHWCVLSIQMALHRSIPNSSIRSTFLIFYNTSHDHEYICGYYALIIVKLSFFFFFFMCMCVLSVLSHPPENHHFLSYQEVTTYR